MRKCILGTDWWTDCDDAVAIRLLARAHKAREVCVLGIAINACMECSVASLEGFLHSEQVYDIPIGIDLAATDFGGRPPYQKRLAAACSKHRQNSDAEDAVRLYRRLLQSSDEKIEIIEIGYLQVMAAVLTSEPDDISPLCGVDLVKDKVSKIWVMAGKWDEECGKENNFTRNARSRAGGKLFCELCPVSVTFLGWEVGVHVLTGGNLREDDVLHRVLCDHGSPDGRDSWDPMLVQMALIGDEKAAGYDTVCGVASVDENAGENRFCVCENGRHKFVVKTMPDEFYATAIDQKIM